MRKICCALCTGALLLVFLSTTSAGADAIQIQIAPEQAGHVIHPNLYGQFAEHVGACIYDGLWVGPDSGIPNDDGLRLDTLEALRALELPVVRWPGGCFADTYHWRDGVGPRAERPHRMTTWGELESNAFGTDEFLRFCKLIGAQPYLCVNVGSGTPEEARDWVEYCNGTLDTPNVNLRKANGHDAPYGVRYWGIGNENWGCGGSMRPEFYADEFRRFATFVHQAAGPEAEIFACGSYITRGAWDERFLATMEDAKHLVDYLAVHYYANQSVPSADFPDETYHKLLAGNVGELEACLERTVNLLKTHRQGKHEIKIALDEWGAWFSDATLEKGFRQQNTMQDALFAAACFHVFHRFGEQLLMSNMAQTANVLQALVLTEGAQFHVTPTYHVYEMFKPHRGGQYIPVALEGTTEIQAPAGVSRPGQSVSASLSAGGGALFVSMLNLEIAQAATVALNVPGAWKPVRMRRLATGDLRSHNTYAAPDRVTPEELPLPDAAALASFSLPPQSITTVLFEK